jgi:hypothetical protein
MTKGIRAMIGALCPVVALAMVTACPGQHGECQFKSTKEADVITVTGRYALVIINSQEMDKLLGADWTRQTLFYAPSAITDTSGKQAMVHGPMLPLAKGSSMLFVSGDDWEDLSCRIYSLETRRMLWLGINTRIPRITVRAPAEVRAGEPVITPEGTLLFK